MGTSNERSEWRPQGDSKTPATVAEEPPKDAKVLGNLDGSRTDGAPMRPELAEGVDPLDAALALALAKAAEAGDLELVASLAEELRARRVATAGNMVTLPIPQRRVR